MAIYALYVYMNLPLYYANKSTDSYFYPLTWHQLSPNQKNKMLHRFDNNLTYLQEDEHI